MSNAYKLILEHCISNVDDNKCVFNSYYQSLRDEIQHYTNCEDKYCESCLYIRQMTIPGNKAKDIDRNSHYDELRRDRYMTPRDVKTLRNMLLLKIHWDLVISFKRIQRRFIQHGYFIKDVISWHC